MPEGIKLKVMEALQEDAYKGIARIDTATMRQLNARQGDVVVIHGTRDTVAIVDRAYPADVGEQIIRIDGIIRRNAKTGIGDSVSVIKADVKEGKKVIIAPAQKGVMVQAGEGVIDMLKRGLLGRAVVHGDLVVIGGTQRRHDVMANSFEDLFNIFGEAFGNNNIRFGFPGFDSTKFVVASTMPKQPVIITESTELVLSPKAIEIIDEHVTEVNYEDIGGLDEEIKKIREMVELPLKHPEIFLKLGIEPPKGILLYGPPGTGKTLLAKAVATESEANFSLLNGPEVMSKFYGESEKRIRDLFDQAEKNAPSIIFIDEIDAIAPKREDSLGEVERRVVSQLLTCMDGLKSRGKVVVIGATNIPNSIDQALRRPGRFDREISINVPNKQGRLKILKIHTRNMPLGNDKKLLDDKEKENLLDDLAKITHGFVGADLSSLCKEAAMNVLREALPKLKLKEEEVISDELLDKLKVNAKDFREALKVVQPSAMREVLVESPNIKWTDVGGLEKTKQELKEAVEWPLKYPESFKRIGIKAPKGILLYGPPGTGKTLLAKAVATESEANFIQVKGASLLSMWVGESEKGVKKVFDRAKQVAPCIIFFDELDAIASRRGMEMGAKVTERVLNQILAEMDGIESLHDIVIIGATNRPDMLDTALLRPGRFDRLILINPPDKAEREEIFKIHARNMPLTKDVDIKFLAEKTEGFVGADIENICREAGMLALRENINAKEVKKKHFDAALKKTGPSVDTEIAKHYKNAEQNYLRAPSVSQKHSYTG